MRTLFFMVFIIAGACLRVNAQNAGEELARHMANKVADSLKLNKKQAAAVYEINMQLHFQKMNARRMYQSQDSLQYHIQKIENTRDSLYATIIPKEKYLDYQKKKRKLVSRD